ncbi:MAG: site-2 protease family protein [Thermoplasmataceae archaeon]
MDSTETPQFDERIKHVAEAVKSRFNIYEVIIEPNLLRFYYLDSDNPDIANSFDSLRIELVPEGYIPFIDKGAENFIGVTFQQKKKYAPVYVNIIMLILTILSTVYAGYLYSQNYVPNGPDFFGRTILFSLVFFTTPLLTILGVHELGHFLVAKKLKVKASLPFFIPFIPIGASIGTFGAFISLRDPIPNRRAMTEIGAAGPIAGFLTAVPLMFVANYLQNIFIPIKHIVPFYLNFPFIYNLFSLSLPISHNQVLFPMVISVWVGIFATAINLMPVGQLDGGHVMRGLLGKRSRFASYFFLFIMIFLGFYYGFFGWLVLAMLIIFLGVTHPPALDDFSKLSKKDIVIGIAAIIMFILCFTANPFVFPT